MKKELQLILVLILTSISNQMYGQTTVTYDLQCSGDGTSYELYITRNATATTPLTTAASSRVTLVLPSGSRTISHTNESNVTYTALPTINNPGDIGNDYYGFSSSGGQSLIGTLTADVPTLWMTFTPSDGLNQDARLFINETDPSSTDAGMNGVDLSNSFFSITIGGLVNEYNGNKSDDTINCGDTLTTVDVELDGLEVYPNPTKDVVYIKGNTNNLKRIEVFNIAGQRVLLEENTFSSLDVSVLESAVYLVKLYNDAGAHKTIKLVKH